MTDRALQALVKMGLEAQWEAQFEALTATLNGDRTEIAVSPSLASSEKYQKNQKEQNKKEKKKGRDFWKILVK